MGRSANQAESVVALLAALGSRTAEDLAAKTLITVGMKAFRPANVSSNLKTCNYVTNQSAFALFLWPMLTCKYQQSRLRWSPSPYAANAAASGNLGKAVVVVAAVPGSEIVELLVTPSAATRGTKASKSAKHGRSPRELTTDSQTRPND